MLTNRIYDQYVYQFIDFMLRLVQPFTSQATSSIDPLPLALPMPTGSEFESIQKYLEEVKYEKLCASCWAQVLIDHKYLDQLLSCSWFRRSCS